eukprot:s3241_g12.t1
MVSGAIARTSMTDGVVQVAAREEAKAGSPLALMSAFKHSKKPRWPAACSSVRRVSGRDSRSARLYLRSLKITCAGRPWPRTKECSGAPGCACHVQVCEYITDAIM